MLSRIKKDDLVVVVSGKDKKRQGRVVSVDQNKEQALVKELGIVTRHVKARNQGEKSRIVKEEGPIPFCKLMPVCSACKKPCRVGVRLLKDKKVRICCRCKEAF